MFYMTIKTHIIFDRKAIFYIECQRIHIEQHNSIDKSHRHCMCLLCRCCNCIFYRRYKSRHNNIVWMRVCVCEREIQNPLILLTGRIKTHTHIQHVSIQWNNRFLMLLDDFGRLRGAERKSSTMPITMTTSKFKFFNVRNAVTNRDRCVNNTTQAIKEHTESIQIQWKKKNPRKSNGVGIENDFVSVNLLCRTNSVTIPE